MTQDERDGYFDGVVFKGWSSYDLDTMVPCKKPRSPEYYEAFKRGQNAS